jgi:putative membrane protein
MIHLLPHLNACLNCLATVLLVVGYRLIRQRREAAHRQMMLACFAVSMLFLSSYVTYHVQVPSVPFPDYPPVAVQTSYRIILLSHIVLAALVPILAPVTIYLGLTNRRRAHVRLARWTFPIWMYVSITGVLVYLLLYQIYPPLERGDKIQGRALRSDMQLEHSPERSS